MRARFVPVQVHAGWSVLYLGVRILVDRGLSFAYVIAESFDVMPILGDMGASRLVCEINISQLQAEPKKPIDQSQAPPAFIDRLNLADVAAQRRDSFLDHGSHPQACLQGRLTKPIVAEPDSAR